MKWIIFVFSMIVACAPIDHSKTQNPFSIKPAADGPTVAAQLTAAYFDTRENCGTLSTPAFLCSGVLFRATNQSAGHHAWNPKPGDILSLFPMFGKMRTLIILLSAQSMASSSILTSMRQLAKFILKYCALSP
jgi:hypothetical protein